MNLVKVKAIINSFRNNLELFEKDFNKNQFFQFSSLEDLKHHLSKDDIEIYSSHLKELKIDIDRRYQDIFELNIPYKSPHEANVDEVKVELREEFIELVADPQLKVNFSQRGYENFWLQEILRQQYQNIWKEIRLFVFPSVVTGIYDEKIIDYFKFS